LLGTATRAANPPRGAQASEHKAGCTRFRAAVTANAKRFRGEQAARTSAASDNGIDNDRPKLGAGQ
jgi:hypothetical protein